MSRLVERHTPDACLGCAPKAQSVASLLLIKVLPSQAWQSAGSPVHMRVSEHRYSKTLRRVFWRNGDTCLIVYDSGTAAGDMQYSKELLRSIL